MNILIVVMNDGAYGSELHKLRAEGVAEDGSVFGYCDFARILIRPRASAPSPWPS